MGEVTQREILPSAETLVNLMSVHEFRRLGYLQEANRLFFHRYGLALAVEVSEDGSERLYGVWDYRDDPEGVLYGEWGARDQERADAVEAERLRHASHRAILFGARATDVTDGTASPDADVQPIGVVPQPA